MKHKYILMGLALAGVSQSAMAAGSDVNIPQMSPKAKIAEDNILSEDALKANDSSGDYQTDILNNAQISERARAKAILNENKFSGGNVAVIHQHGKSNISAVKQIGNNNYTKQAQTGNKNNLHIEQVGKNNRSIEHQTGDNNHKVIIQNGNKREETETNTEE